MPFRRCALHPLPPVAEDEGLNIPHGSRAPEGSYRYRAGGECHVAVRAPASQPPSGHDDKVSAHWSNASAHQHFREVELARREINQSAAQSRDDVNNANRPVGAALGHDLCVSHCWCALFPALTVFATPIRLWNWRSGISFSSGATLNSPGLLCLQARRPHSGVETEADLRDIHTGELRGAAFVRFPSWRQRLPSRSPDAYSAGPAASRLRFPFLYPKQSACRRLQLPGCPFRLPLAYLLVMLPSLLLARMSRKDQFPVRPSYIPWAHDLRFSSFGAVDRC